MGITQRQVEEALKTVKYPGFSRDIVSFGLVREIRVEGGKVHVLVEHRIDDAATLETFQQEAQRALDGIEGVEEAHIEWRGKAASEGKGDEKGTPAGKPEVSTASAGASAKTATKGGYVAAPSLSTPSPDPWADQAPLPGVKAVIAVASAKGGVGKSTVATNLALALSAKGKKVGLLDADIYGPSLPTMMGVNERPEVQDGNKILPVMKEGIACMSIGFLVPQDKAMIWRGPMVMGAINQFLDDVRWNGLDVLIVDLPPGTGDAQLSLAQKVPLTGVIMVTTPQDVAVIDVVRGIQMFEETKVPIVGIIENMSVFVCPHCGHEEHIFGEGGGKRTAERFGVPYLGGIPLEPAVVATGDEGRPVVVARPDSASAKAFLAVAEQVEQYLQTPHGGHHHGHGHGGHSHAGHGH